jgi:uncharacterized phage-associated protein
MRLLKMLYMADRASMKKIGRTVTGDRPFAMDNGPVLTRVYNLIKGEDSENTLWDKFIQRKGGQDVELIAETGNEELSEFELNLLVEIARDRRERDDYAVADETHDFQEWIKNRPEKGSSKIIPWDDVLESLGLLELKATLANEAFARSRENQLMG